MQGSGINHYLVANCLNIIDEFNMLYKELDKDKLKDIADEKYNEIDITVRLGYPFKQTAHYTAGESSRKRKEKKIHHDIYVEQNDFKIEVKYLKNWISTSDTRSVSKMWKEFQQDFDWLMDEIDAGNKYKVAFVIGWFNCVKSFSQLVQLGQGRGAYPMANEDRVQYFPFLGRPHVPVRTADLYYNYKERAYKELSIAPIRARSKEYNCIFLGNESDSFHFAIYY